MIRGFIIQIIAEGVDLWWRSVGDARVAKALADHDVMRARIFTERLIDTLPSAKIVPFPANQNHSEPPPAA
jgi:hypothetical protein